LYLLLYLLELLAGTHFIWTDIICISLFSGNATPVSSSRLSLSVPQFCRIFTPQSYTGSWHRPSENIKEPCGNRSVSHRENHHWCYR